jgi:hypothetical protein
VVEQRNVKEANSGALLAVWKSSDGTLGSNEPPNQQMKQFIIPITTYLAM